MFRKILKIYRQNKFIFFFQALDKVFFFAFFWLIAKTISVSDFGNIIVVFSVSNILYYILQFGFPIYLQNVSAKNKKISFNDTEIAIKLGFVIFLAGNIIGLIISKFLYSDISGLLVILVNSFVFSYYFISIFNSILISQYRYKFQFYVILLFRLFLIIVLMFFHIYFIQINIFLLLSIICNILTAVILYLYIYKGFFAGCKKFKIVLTEYKNFFIASLPLGIASMINYLYDKIDIIILSKLLDIEQVAYYNISYGLFKSSQLLFSFILVAGFTRVSYLSKRKSAVILFFKKYLLYVVSISILIFIFLLSLSDTVILYLYGERYRSSVYILQLLSITIIPLALNNLTGITLNGLGLFHMNLKIVTISLLFNIVSNLVLINYIGIYGAVISTFFTESFIFILGMFVINRKLKLI